MEEDNRHWKGKQGTNKTVRKLHLYRDQQKDVTQTMLYDTKTERVMSYKKNQGWQVARLFAFVLFDLFVLWRSLQ
jgi:hypothetical protein